MGFEPEAASWIAGNGLGAARILRARVREAGGGVWCPPAPGETVGAPCPGSQGPTGGRRTLGLGSALFWRRVMWQELVI